MDQPGRAAIEADLDMSRRLFLRRTLAVAAGVAVLGVAAACGNGDSEAPQIGSSQEATQKSETETPQTNGEFSARSSWEINFEEMRDGAPIDTDALRPNLNPEVPTWEGEAQGYTDHDANMQVKDGALLVTARKEKYQYPDGDRTTYEYTAARLETFDSHNNQEIPNGLTFEYGKIEIVAKLPEGKGVFAAPLWLLSANNPVAAKRVEAELAKLGNVSEEEYAEKESQLWGKYYKLGGELDFESYGDANKVELTHHTMNTGKYGDGAMLTVKDATEKFHKYGIAVTPDKVTWYIDDKEVRSFKKTSDNAEDWPFGNGNKLYAVTNLAMRAPEGGKIDNSKGPWHMPIKRLSFYEYKGDK